MNSARPSDGLLSGKHTLTLIDLICQRLNGCPEDRALDDLSALAHPSRSRARNTIATLTSFGVFTRDEQQLIRSDVVKSPEGWRLHLGDLTAATMARRIALEGPRCLQSRGDQGLWLNALLVPGFEDGLALWLIEFEVAVRGDTRDRFWRVTKRHESAFLEAARTANRARAARVVTPAQLERDLAAKAEFGLEAERWVLDYERRRLSTHPLCDQIRRISDENVAAGYDIASFSGFSVLHHDLHIEVKSFEGRKHFFWTRNEIDVAAALGENYALYLVDRARIRETDYVPEIIVGPHAALFLADPAGWEISPTTFECVATT